MALGKQVRKYRERAGWKLETLSFKSGVEVGTINALENRDSSRSKFAPQLAKAFGLTLEQLLDEGMDYEVGAKQVATGEGEMLPAGGTLQAPALLAQGSGEVSLTRALEVVALALQDADALSLIQAKPLLQHLMEHPDQAGQIAPRLAVLLGKLPVPAAETSDFAGQPPATQSFQKTKNSA